MKPRIGYPSSFGWLRFPKADVPNLLCYETPNGEHRFIPKDGSFCLVQFDGDPRPAIKSMRTKATQ